MKGANLTRRYLRVTNLQKGTSVIYKFVDDVCNHHQVLDLPQDFYDKYSLSYTMVSDLARGREYKCVKKVPITNHVKVERIKMTKGEYEKHPEALHNLVKLSP